MTAVYNGYVIHSEIQHNKEPFINFLVNVSLIQKGRENLPHRRERSYGRPSKTSKLVSNEGDHMPVKQKGLRK